MLTDKELESGNGNLPYYHALGLQHDAILRCKDCKTLVTHTHLKQRGCCECGNRRVTEVTTLSPWEWFKIRFGILRFEHSREFLQEFSRGQ